MAARVKVPKRRITQKIVVVALIRNRRGQVLMQQRMKGKFPQAADKWEFPGGKVEPGETPHAALVREIREEVSCRVRIGPLLAAHSRIWRRTDGARVHAVVMCYAADYVSGRPRPEKGKASAVRWCTLEQIDEMDCLDGTDLFLASAISTHRLF